ncbi:MAG: BrnT family toxin [Candidatus Acidiferrum sp.]
MIPAHSCPLLWYNCYISMRFHFEARKSNQLRKNPKRGIGFEEAQQVFFHPYYLDQRADLSRQHRAIGWVGDRLYSVIFEVREDAEGEFYHLVTLWKATKQERTLYEKHIS